MFRITRKKNQILAFQSSAVSCAALWPPFCYRAALASCPQITGEIFFNRRRTRGLDTTSTRRGTERWAAADRPSTDFLSWPSFPSRVAIQSRPVSHHVTNPVRRRRATPRTSQPGHHHRLPQRLVPDPHDRATYPVGHARGRSRRRPIPRAPHRTRVGRQPASANHARGHGSLRRPALTGAWDQELPGPACHRVDAGQRG
jgi:hypothetical protein